MSQFPPPPPPPGGYPGGYPQGYPPPGGLPPQGYPAPMGPGGLPLGGALMPKKSNGAALASLICSLLGLCVPGLSLIGLLLGILGIRNAKGPYAPGRGMAITGLILGVLFTGCWGMVGVGIWTAVPAFKTSAGFYEELVAGDVEGAKAFTTSNVDPQEIQRAIDEMKSKGQFRTFQWNMSAGSSLDDTKVVAKVVFSGGTVSMSGRVTKQPDGGYKITEFDVK